MKIRIVKISPESLVGLLHGRVSTFTSNLPSDAEILDIKMDLFTKQVSLVVRSDSFEDVAESISFPELILSKTVESNGPVKSSVTLKPQASTEPKSNIAKLPQPQPSRMANKMENEFSPDQRKLLSFTAKENCVMVKPVMFLKAEWDDINEVVRSLGGKWVKGEIISFWEIPLQ
jgi:hypothetical protein